MNRNRIPTVNALAKAESWLSDVAEHIKEVSDQEALVYQKSRGRECSEQVTALVKMWHFSEQKRLKEYGKRVGKAGRAEPNITDLLDVPPILLPGFWEGASPEDYSFEATMLRTVEWCKIAGFDQWWRRLARGSKEKLFQGGIEESPHSAYWLFTMVRSDYAITLMPRVLDAYLESISLADPNKKRPWVLDNSEDQHVSYASAIVFAHHRLTPESLEPGIVPQAIEAICKFQNHDGGWPTFGSDSDPSIESTAMALHALALARPAGWPHMAASAHDWLWSVQQKDGAWSEPGTPGSVYLTVLVLDAIALANREKTLTFRLAPKPGEADRLKPQGPHTSLQVVNWADIEISFLSDERIRIRSGGQTESCNYEELGFSDARNGKPKRAWMILRTLAASGGVIIDTQETRGDWPMVEKRIQEIRKLMRQYFGIAIDPLPYVEGTGYRARFRIVNAPSYET